MSRFTQQKFKTHKSDIRGRHRKAGVDTYELAKSYERLYKDCADDTEFKRFLMDPADGIGLTSNEVGKADRQRKALRIVVDKAVWARFNWEGGVCTIYSIKDGDEREAVYEEVMTKLGASGRRKLSKADLKVIIRDKAPSHKPNDKKTGGH